MALRRVHRALAPPHDRPGALVAARQVADGALTVRRLAQAERAARSAGGRSPEARSAAARPGVSRDGRGEFCRDWR